MRDQYVGDVGDFGKYGLLRALCLGLAGCVDEKPSGLGDGQRELTLGVQWYRSHGGGMTNNDGKFTDYLDGATPTSRRLLACDEDLAEVLKHILRSDRSIESVQRWSVLPKGTVFFGEGLNFDDLRPSQHQQRRERRQEWNERACAELDGLDIVFCDPDNGLAGLNTSLTDKNGPKYISCDELTPYWERGQSLVIYQHFGRNGNAEQQIRRNAARLRETLGACSHVDSVIALRYHRSISRVFFVIPNPQKPEVAQLLKDRVDAFLECCWGQDPHRHFSQVDC